MGQEIMLGEQETVTLADAEKNIRDGLGNAVKSVIAVGYYLKKIRDNHLYESAGYENIWEYASDRFGFSMSTASRYMARNDRFSRDGNSPELDARYEGFSKSQLQEMLSLDDEQMEQVTPDMTVKEIRQIRKPDIPYYPIPGQMEINDFLETMDEEETEAQEPAEQPEKVTMQISDFIERPDEPSVPELEEMDTVVRDGYCNAAARKLIESYHDWMLEDFSNRVTDVCASEMEFKAKFREGSTFWHFTAPDDTGVAHVNLFDDYIQFWNGKGKCLGNCEWFYLCAAIQSMWNVIAMEKAQETVKSIATSQQDDCPPGISYCIRQEWGTEPEQQETGRKECGKCWEQWKKSHKNLVVQQEEREELEHQEIEEASEAIPMEECNDLELLREMLRKEQNDLEEILKVNKVEPLPPNMVKKKKLLVGALAGMICDLENAEGSGEGEQELPELPRLVNNEERKAWLEDYPSWGLWYEDTHIGVKYYKYDFDNGAKLIVEEYISQYGFDKKTEITCPYYHLIGGPQVKGAKWSYHDRYNKYPNSKTELIEFLKELQKNGSNT